MFGIRKPTEQDAIIQVVASYVNIFLTALVFYEWILASVSPRQQSMRLTPLLPAPA